MFQSDNYAFVEIVLPASCMRYIYIGFVFSNNTPANLLECKSLRGSDNVLVSLEKIEVCEKVTMHKQFNEIAGLVDTRTECAGLGGRKYNHDLLLINQGRFKYVLHSFELMRAMLLESSMYVDDVMALGSIEGNVDSVKRVRGELVIALNKKCKNVLVEQHRIEMLARYFLDAEYRLFYRGFCTQFLNGEVPVNRSLFFGECNVPPVLLNEVSGSRTDSWFYITHIKKLDYVNKLPVQFVRVKSMGQWYRFRIL